MASAAPGVEGACRPVVVGEGSAEGESAHRRVLLLNTRHARAAPCFFFEEGRAGRERGRVGVRITHAGVGERVRAGASVTKSEKNRRLGLNPARARSPPPSCSLHTNKFSFRPTHPPFPHPTHHHGLRQGHQVLPVLLPVPGASGWGAGRRARAARAARGRGRGKRGRQSTRRRWAAAGGRPARRGSPAHARRPRPPGPVVVGVPGCLPGASRPPKPSGPPRPTAFCGARQGRRRGHALATPPLSQPRTAARGHWSSRRRPGRDRTWDSVPAFWQWDGVLLAGGRRPPVAKHAARLRSQEEGGPPPAAPVACFFHFPRSHTTTPPPLTPSHRSSTGAAARARPTTGPASG